MDAFSFVFSLFGLLLGLALAEVVGGFGAAMQERRKIHVGTLTPLLGLIVAFDLTSFWTLAWQVRAGIPARYISLLCSLVVTGVYYLAARLVFPRDYAEWPDFDVYYFEHKKWVLAGVFLCNMVAIGLQAALGRSPIGTAFDVWTSLAFYPPLFLAIFVPGKRLNVALLAFIAIQYPITSLAYFLPGTNT
jgi:multidrug transporter EmrE-like cation transporter